MSAKKAKMGSGGMRRTRSVENQPKENPMRNELILESIFGYLSVRDLKVVRRVSPLWRDCARKKWNKSVKLKIERVRESSPQGKRKFEKYKQFLQMVESEQVPPLGTGIQGNWTALCAQIKTLELDSITLPTVKSLRNTLFVCFPNLEHLILGTVKILKVGHASSRPTVTVQQALDIWREDQQQNLKSLEVRLTNRLPISWMEVLAHFSCLETINVTTCEMAASIFQAVNQIREEDPSKLNLKHVNIQADFIPGSGNIAPAAVTTLMDRRLQLETLGIRMMLGRHVVSTFLDILQVHAGTLKNLSFSYRHDVVRLPQEFPELKNLQELELRLYHSVELITLLKFTPNLSKLVLISYNYPRIEGHHCSNLAQFPVMLSTCKELVIWDNNGIFSTNNIKSFAEWTPNLEILRIKTVDNAKFAIICEYWSNLVELHVRSSQVDTSGITGWDEEDVKGLDSRRRPKNSAAPRWRPITVPRANVTCLKNLQIFTMSKFDFPRISLTRAAGIYGIEMLRNLRRLRLKSYKVKPKDRAYWEEQHERYPWPV